LNTADALDLFLRFAALSLLAVGGALGTAPEMRRFLVDERQWITGVQFTDSIAIAQAAPGPNILFVTLLGWQAGGALGAFAATAGLMLPSSVVTWSAWRWKRATQNWPVAISDGEWSWDSGPSKRRAIPIRSPMRCLATGRFLNRPRGCCIASWPRAAKHWPAT
jgi:hypothetical protein